MRQPFSSSDTLTTAQRSAERTLPRPDTGRTDERPEVRHRIRPAKRILVRGPWEMAASALIGVGVVMLMQPYFMWAYSWSFIVTLVGTVMFIIVSHFPE
jgi:hypothetical protein